MNISVESITGDMQGLKGIVIISLPENFLIHSWQEEEEIWDAELVGANVGSILKTNQKTLEALGVGKLNSVSTTETDDLVLTIRPLSNDFGLGCVFDRKTPIGMIRLYGDRLHNRLLRDLEFEKKDTNPGQHLMTSISTSSTNLDADLLRISLHSGIELERFQNPEQWSKDEQEKIQRSAESILGVSI